MKKALSLFLGAALCAAALSGCSSKNDLQTVRLCEVTHSIFYAPQYAAMELGYFAEEGIEIELSNGGGADKVMSAVLSDSMDIGLAGPEACIYVYNEGKEDYPQVFAQLTKRDGSMLVGRTEQPDFTWQSLKGSHILPGRKGGVPYMAFEYALKENGLDPAADLLLDTSVQFDNMTGAFLGGTADYVTVFEPAASSLQAEGKGYIVAAVGDAVGDLPYTAYFAKSSYMEENPELIQGFANAVAKGEAWVKTHSAKEVAKLVAPHFADTDLELLTSAVENYQKVGAYCETPAMSEEGFERLQTIMESAGELSQRAAFDAVVNNTFAEKAVSTN
ncbi:MAG TPA: ABC transporter substrate-binding protein [Candidatus Ruthenibacterium avium]|uniref:ABC transporter substrate-binding protein n=1 Tax=Candidatus Ruthenibacterium avium TaxID=2838751 RepID=A0A9D2M2Y5_9FIRM|nr:ABC transporter substrate-binding protein [Candidatus Ruthenibacterium avium]